MGKIEPAATTTPSSLTSETPKSEEKSRRRRSRSRSRDRSSSKKSNQKSRDRSSSVGSLVKKYGFTSPPKSWQSFKKKVPELGPNEMNLLIRDLIASYPDELRISDKELRKTTLSAEKAVDFDRQNRLPLPSSYDLECALVFVGDAKDLRLSDHLHAPEFPKVSIKQTKTKKSISWSERPSKVISSNYESREEVLKKISSHEQKRFFEIIESSEQPKLEDQIPDLTINKVKNWKVRAWNVGKDDFVNTKMGCPKPFIFQSQLDAWQMEGEIFQIFVIF